MSFAAALKDAGDNWLKVGNEPWNKFVQREYMKANSNEAHMSSRKESNNTEWIDDLLDKNSTRKKEKKGKKKTKKNTSLVPWIGGDELANKAKAPIFLVNNILESDSHGILAGASMAFKSFFAVALAHSICSGTDFMGNTVFQSGKVVYVCGEGMGALGRRLKVMKDTCSSFSGNLVVIKLPIRIDNSVEMASLKSELRVLKPVLVIFDTFSSLSSDVNENDNAEVAKCLSLVKGHAVVKLVHLA